jgi:glucosamine-6-phosphate deaminase
MNQNITEEDVKDYVELTDIGNEENQPDPDKLNKLLSHSRKFPKLKIFKIGKGSIAIIVSLIIIIFFVYISIKNIFGYSAKFKLIRVRNKQEVSKKAGDIIIDLIQKKSNSKISLSSGVLPKSIYKYLIDKFQDKEISFENTTIFSLDDYCGLNSDSKKSHSYYIKDNLLDHIDIKQKNIYLINGDGDSCKENADKYNKLLEENEIDLQLLTLENDFNLGFNEAGTSFDSKTHVMELSSHKKEQIAELFDFESNNIPTYGITQGINNILNSKSILVVASGKEKAEGIKKLIKGGADIEVPISALNNHLRLIYVIADEDATQSYN